MIIAVEGVLAGAAHVFTGPDHLVGVAPLAVDRAPRLRPAWVGATWGLGHGLGVAVLGALGQGLLSLTELEVASGWAERLVGVVLIVLGALAIRRARNTVVHEHVHTHDGAAHVHLHVHDASRADAHAAAHAGGGHHHAHTAFGVGVVHGLAGAGHFWAVLPSLAMPPAAAAVFIGSYLLATTLAMTLFGAALGRFAHALGPYALRRLLVVVGGVTVAIGVAWLALNLAG